MPINLRSATPADYPAIAALLSAANPRRPASAEGLMQTEKKAREHPLGLHLAQWVAEEAGQLRGFAGVTQWAGSYHSDRYGVMLAVHPDHTRQGIGAALAQTLDAHLRGRGAREVLAGAYEDEPHAVRFLAARGFDEVVREFDNVLTLADFVLAQWETQKQLPGGFRHVTLTRLMGEQGEEAALSAFGACFNAGRADEPRPVDAKPYTLGDLRAYVQHPSALPDGIHLALTDTGEVAALSEIWLDLSDPTRLNTGLTATARNHRRKGLALALKLRALDVALARGVQTVWTTNATTNAPMLALNERLGFRPQPAYIEMKRGTL